ncbi:MAG: chromate transporter, partial [Methanobrevibacter sp.]|nr:chromate transporter [Methanobrevibacter sp.]
MIVNLATYIGNTQGGLLGALVATLGVVLPCFVIIVLITAVMSKF